MDSQAALFIERARNEIIVATRLKVMGEDEDIKKLLKIEKGETFYSSVISHSYYAIFYAAKAVLLAKGIKTSPPEVHKKTFDAFKKNLVDTGILDVKLLNIYKKLVIRADSLLEIFKSEKWKRGHFTYNTIPQANKGPAEDSVKNAQLFVSNIAKVLHK